MISEHEILAAAQQHLIERMIDNPAVRSLPASALRLIALAMCSFALKVSADTVAELRRDILPP